MHTATSSGEVYSMISVHKFELFIVPKFFWLLFELHASLYNIYGNPVDIYASTISYHNYLAFIVTLPIFSFSYLVYNYSNLSP